MRESWECTCDGREPVMVSPVQAEPSTAPAESRESTDPAWAVCVRCSHTKQIHTTNGPMGNTMCDVMGCPCMEFESARAS